MSETLPNFEFSVLGVLFLFRSVTYLLIGDILLKGLQISYEIKI